jgi:hypothetical protein
MGLRRGKVQSISTGFYILPRGDDKEASTYQEKRYVQKKERRRKVSIKKHNVARLGLGGLRRKKRREESLSANHTEKYCKETVYGTNMSIFFAYTQKNSAIASGATPIGSAVAHLIERSQSEKDGKSKPMVKNQLVDKWFRRNWLHFINNELRLHC